MTTTVATPGRNTVLSICKGIAIILMVIGHAECPGMLCNFIYLFHMPVFFIAAGYFFSRKYLSDPWTFVVKRFRGLYVPFVKWSVLFLLLHNVLFYFGILNEQYGNWEGGVLHPYTWHDMAFRISAIVFSMGGYDEFMAGAFWFFRALLLSSILFLVLDLLVERHVPRMQGVRAVWLILLAALAFALFKISNNVKIVTVVQGGIREVWGVAFFAIGVLYRTYEQRIREHWALTLAYLALLIGAAWLHCAGMNLKPKPIDVLTLPITGTIGFLMVHHVSKVIDSRGGILRRFLVICGDMSVYIYVFHIASFKLVSLLKIAVYNLDFAQIGCHMVIHYRNDDLFWVLYTIAGVGIPMLWMCVYRKISARLMRAKS